jgi:hypothetical protein
MIVAKGKVPSIAMMLNYSMLETSGLVIPKIITRLP